MYDDRHWAVLDELAVVRSVEDGLENSIPMPSGCDQPERPLWMADSPVNRRDVLREMEQRLAPADADYLYDLPELYLALKGHQIMMSCLQFGLGLNIGPVVDQIMD